MRSKLRMVASTNLPYGESYDGDLVTGLRHGKGTYKYRDGSVYSGQWSLGIMHGKGELRSANGTVYTGQWDQGTPHGLGEVRYADGRHYVGDWYRGKMHGQGVLTWTKGKGGRGRPVASASKDVNETATRPSSRESAGAASIRSHATATSAGHAGRGAANTAQGKGTATSAMDTRPSSRGSASSAGPGRGVARAMQPAPSSVDRYSGAFHLDKPQGEGRYEYADGSWYEGAWKEGYKHGPGVMVWADGSRYEGKWQYSTVVEPGVLLTPGTLALGVEPPVSPEFERLLKTAGPESALCRLRAERQGGQKARKQRRLSGLYSDSTGLRFGLPPPPQKLPKEKRPSSRDSSASGGATRAGRNKEKDRAASGHVADHATGQTEVTISSRPQLDTSQDASMAQALPAVSVRGLGSLGSVTSATPTALGSVALRPSTTTTVHTPGAARHLDGGAAGTGAGAIAGQGGPLSPSAIEVAQARGAFTSSAVAHSRVPVHLTPLPSLHGTAQGQAQASPPTRAGTASSVISPLQPVAGRGRAAAPPAGNVASGVGVSGSPPQGLGSPSTSGWQGSPVQEQSMHTSMQYSYGSLPSAGGMEYAPAVNRFASMESQGILSPSFTQKIQRTLEAAHVVPKAGQALPPVGIPVPPFVEAVYDYADLEEVACGARATSRAFRRRSFLQGPSLRTNGSLSPKGDAHPALRAALPLPKSALIRLGLLIVPLEEAASRESELAHLGPTACPCFERMQERVPAPLQA